MPESLGQFLALGLDGLNTLVKHSSNARKANGADHQAQNESNYEFAHDVSLYNFNTVQLSFAIAVTFYCAGNTEAITCRKWIEPSK